MKRTLVVMAAVLVAACGSFGGAREAERYFILDAAPAAAAVTQPGPAVVVAPTSAASFYDTQDIAYSRAAGTRAYYQFSHWTERPQRAIHDGLASRLGAGGLSRGGVPILVTQLEEIYHDAAQHAGSQHASRSPRSWWTLAAGRCWRFTASAARRWRLPTTHPAP